MFKNLEKRFNNRLLDRIIGTSYLGDRGQRFLEKIKKTRIEAYAHILNQREKFKQRYRE